MNHLPQEVEILHIFCDGAGGQNKNYAFVRFTHYMVHVVKRFKAIYVTFPVRGHSYLECDKNMGLINTKIRMESPGDWKQTIATARVKPTPFHVISVEQKFVKQWTEFFLPKYAKKCPFPMQKMKEFQMTSDHSRLVRHRESYNGPMLDSSLLSVVQCKGLVPTESTGSEVELPSQSYFELLPIDDDKYRDLVFLSKFCFSDNAKLLYENIPHVEKCKRKRKQNPLSANPSENSSDVPNPKIRRYGTRSTVSQKIGCKNHTTQKKAASNTTVPRKTNR